jgi:hypothetical protein
MRKLAKLALLSLASYGVYTLLSCAQAFAIAATRN